RRHGFRFTGRWLEFRKLLADDDVLHGKMCVPHGDLLGLDAVSFPIDYLDRILTWFVEYGDRHQAENVAVRLGKQLNSPPVHSRGPGCRRSMDADDAALRHYARRYFDRLAVNRPCSNKQKSNHTSRIFRKRAVLVCRYETLLYLVRHVARCVD